MSGSFAPNNKPLILTYTPGRYYQSLSNIGANITSVWNSTGVMYLSPILISENIKIDAIALNNNIQSPSGTSSCELALCSSNQGIPDKVIHSFGNLPIGSTTGIKVLQFPAIPINKGLYYIAFRSLDFFGITAMNLIQNGQSAWINAASVHLGLNSSFNSWFLYTAFGSIPAVGESLSVGLNGGAIPIFYVRIA